MSASQSLLKFATLQLTDFNVFALFLPEPLINATISATSHLCPVVPPYCDAFRDPSHLPFCLLEYEKDVLDIMPCCTPSPKRKQKSLHQPFVVGSLQHSPSTGHRLRAGT